MDNKTPPTDADVSANISDSLSRLNDQRSAELNNLKSFQQLRDAMLQVETKRLTAKYGQDHPRVVQLQARLVYHEQLFQGLDTEIARVNIKTTPLPVDAWRIQGRVFDAKNNPMKGITVFLADGNKEWLRLTGSSCTDDGGNYSLTLDSKTIDSTKQQPLFLSASDKDKKLLYTAASSVIPTRGIADFADIHLGGEADACIPPPTPGNDTKPVDTKPVDTKPADGKIADGKTADGKTADGKTGADKKTK
ncbi:MAG TPA: hypothetical protein VK563_10645 [Puia sp.]|nr:hypothetical protein [Puia sp.]